MYFEPDAPIDPPSGFHTWDEQSQPLSVPLAKSETFFKPSWFDRVQVRTVLSPYTRTFYPLSHRKKSSHRVRLAPCATTRPLPKLTSPPEAPKWSAFCKNSARPT
jgi:hypothetical protein